MSIEPEARSNGRKLFPQAAVLSAVILGIQAAASIAPSGRLWGIHAFGFLPPHHLLISIAALGAVILLCSRWDPATRLAGIARWAARRPLAALLISWGILAACLLLRRAAIPILGDGYTVINNFRNTLAGVHPLGTAHEPLGMAFFYSLARVLGADGGLSATDAILAGDILLIALFIACAGRTAMELFPGTGDGRQALALLFVLSLPYLQLFFGYVEVYAVVLTAMSVTMLGVVLYLRGKLPFLLLPPLFALQISVHYLGGLMIPLLLFLGVREWREAGGRSVVTGALLALPVLLPVPIWLGWSRLLPPAPHSHILPLATIGDSYTAYTLLSGAHLLDVINLLLFMGAGPLLALALWRGRGASPDVAGLTVSLALAVVPPLIFAFTAKFDLGMAKDWDVTAPYFYPMALLGAHRLLSRGAPAIRAMSVIVAASALSTASFINLNADREASLSRVKTLMDPSIMARGGIYQTAIHLSTAYLETREIDSMVVLWRDFIGRYPDDQRGYQKLAKSMWEYGESAFVPIMNVFELCLARTGGDSSVRRQYAQFCVYAGVSSMKGGRPDEARERFAKAMNLDPEFAPPYFQMGVSYLRDGKADSALPYLRHAVALNPGDVRALESIIGAYTMMGDSVESLRAYQAAAAAGSRTAGEYLARRGRGGGDR